MASRFCLAGQFFICGMGGGGTQFGAEVLDLVNRIDVASVEPVISTVGGDEVVEA